MDVFTITTANVDDKIRVLHFSGYLNEVAGVELMRECDAALGEGRTDIIIAFHDCPAIASPGLAALMELMMRVLDDFQGNLIFTGLDENKLNLLSVIGLYPIVPHADSLDEAKALLT